jgi:hypothetical protein
VPDSSSNTTEKPHQQQQMLAVPAGKLDKEALTKTVFGKDLEVSSRLAGCSGIVRLLFRQRNALSLVFPHCCMEFGRQCSWSAMQLLCLLVHAANARCVGDSYCCLCSVLAVAFAVSPGTWLVNLSAPCLFCCVSGL